MPYTQSGITPGGNYGDYYRGDYYRGDPFLGGIIKSIGKAVVGGVTGFVKGGPLGAITGAAGAVLKPKAQASVVQGTALAPYPEARHPVEIKLPFGTGLNVGTPVYGPSGQVIAMRKRGRGMNPMNPKALKRAGRRIDRFTKSVRGALKHTPYTLVRRGRGRGGSPGVITKAEASKALRR